MRGNVLSEKHFFFHPVALERVAADAQNLRSTFWPHGGGSAPLTFGLGAIYHDPSDFSSRFCILLQA